MPAANDGHNGRTERGLRGSFGDGLPLLSGLFLGLLFGPLVSGFGRLYTHATFLGGFARWSPSCPTECFQ